jgi:hypothetical protein
MREQLSSESLLTSALSGTFAFHMLLHQGRTQEWRNAPIFLWFAGRSCVARGERGTGKRCRSEQVAQIVANELSRNRYDGEEIAVLVFNDSGQLIHKVWTKPADAAVATKQTLFPDHVHPKGFYQIRPAAAATSRGVYDNGAD